MTNSPSSVDHPNLVRYHEHGKAHGKTGRKYYWIAMEYLGEKNLAELLAASEYRLDVEVALIIGEHILRGLAALHERQFIHRDLKPDNAMVDDEFRVRLIDFGLGKQFHADGKQTMGPTVAGDLIGTPRYMSPEQVTGEGTLTLATDVWSFGLILYELLVGEPLFLVPNIAMLGHEIFTKQVTFDHERIPQEMRPVLQGCLKKQPSERFADAQLVLSEFNAATDQLRRRANHERYLPVWLAVFEKRLLETFVAENHGDFDTKTVATFIKFAAHHGISGLDSIALARVLPPTSIAQRAAEWAAQEVAQAKSALSRELEALSSDQISQRNANIKKLEELHADAIESVTVKIRRELADEAKEWDQLQAEAREREKRKTQRLHQQRESLRREEAAKAETLQREEAELLRRYDVMARQAVSRPAHAMRLCAIVGLVLNNVTGVVICVSAGFAEDIGKPYLPFWPHVPLLFGFLGGLGCACACSLLAATSMLKLRSYRFVVLGSICIMASGPITFLAGIPIGIWCLSALFRAEVQTAFGYVPGRSGHSDFLSKNRFNKSGNSALLVILLIVGSVFLLLACIAAGIGWVVSSAAKQVQMVQKDFQKNFPLANIDFPPPKDLPKGQKAKTQSFNLGNLQPQTFQERQFVFQKNKRVIITSLSKSNEFADVDLYVYRGVAGNNVVTADGSIGPNSRVDFIVPETDTYRVRIISVAGGNVTSTAVTIDEY